MYVALLISIMKAKWERNRALSTWGPKAFSLENLKKTIENYAHNDIQVKGSVHKL